MSDHGLTPRLSDIVQRYSWWSQTISLGIKLQKNQLNFHSSDERSVDKYAVQFEAENGGLIIGKYSESIHGAAVNPWPDILQKDVVIVTAIVSLCLPHLSVLMPVIDSYYWIPFYGELLL